LKNPARPVQFFGKDNAANLTGAFPVESFQAIPSGFNFYLDRINPSTIVPTYGAGRIVRIIILLEVS
jgi:hypothetical protein